MPARDTTDGRHRSGSLVDEVADKIQARVMGGTIAIGSWLRQETLAEEFGVSRTPVREALRKLEAGGLVHFVPHRGALVRGPTPRQIREAYLVRAELEGLAAELAARWIRDDQLERLQEAQELFRRAVADLARGRRRRSKPSAYGDEPWFQANTLFHEAVQEAAGNEQLAAVIRHLHRTFPRNVTWAALHDSLRLLEENVAEHGRILAAIENGDAGGARHLMVDHVRRAGDLVAAWFERQASDFQSAGRNT
jgi:DNA-binding GntR family transcriptional regulator